MKPSAKAMTQGPKPEMGKTEQLVHQLTRRYYENNAEEYATTTAAAPMLPLVAEFARRLSPGSLVVDLGCGSGRDLCSFGARGLRPIGVDYVELLARYAFRMTGLPVIVADFRRIPLRDATVDGAWAAASLLHLRRNEIGLALREIERVLKPGGLLFASMKRGFGEGRDANGRWFTYFESQEWEATLRSAGFVEIQVDYDREIRPLAGSIVPVTWLVSLARGSAGRRQLPNLRSRMAP